MTLRRIWALIKHNNNDLLNGPRYLRGEYSGNIIQLDAVRTSYPEKQMSLI